MYVVVRSDLSPADQACQGMHALVEFSQLYTLTYNSWYAQDSELRLMAAPDDALLETLCIRAADAGIRFAKVKDRRLGGSLTACCFEPSERAKRLVVALTTLA